MYAFAAHCRSRCLKPFHTHLAGTHDNRAGPADVCLDGPAEQALWSICCPDQESCCARQCIAYLEALRLCKTVPDTADLNVQLILACDLVDYSYESRERIKNHRSSKHTVLFIAETSVVSLCLHR